MTDNDANNANPEDFHDVAQKSLDAGIADESAAYESAIKGDEADDEVAEGKWKSTDDGSGTSETD
jgi:hypothetical protein